MDKKIRPAKSLNLLEPIGSIGANMPKTISAYLGKQAVANLEAIRKNHQYFGTTPSDSAIVTEALNAYIWYLSNCFSTGKPVCPAVGCGEELEIGIETCPSCGTALKWMASVNPYPSLIALGNQLRNQIIESQKLTVTKETVQISTQSEKG